MPDWTLQQSKAIETLGGTILVSAAAGSGKTAVLVERIIRRLSDVNNPLYADKLLIVTFTRAAATEMKLKIQKALRNSIRNSQTSQEVRKLLKYQESLLQQASISTVDSFCVKLTREFFYKLGINENYKILDDKQQENLTNQAMETVIQNYFSQSSHELADVFSTDRNDKALISAILKLYNYTRSHIFPEEWMDDTLRLYSEFSSTEESLWGKKIVSEAAEKLEYCVNLSNKCLEIILEEQLSGKLSECFDDLNSSLSCVFESFSVSKWDDLETNLCKIKFASRFPTPKGMKDDPVINKLHNFYDEIKDNVNKIKQYFLDSDIEIKAEIRSIGNLYSELVKLVKQFTEEYSRLKAEKNTADYGDIEHWAVQLLINRDRTRTQLATELSQRFNEIMIDEYQDTNEVQDEIFKALSKGDDTNRFMVGDIKQSIYGFRLAMPEIFLKYKKSFHDADNSSDFPQVINLDRNFRSSPEVIDTVNYFFCLLMSEGTGGVDYLSGEKLNLGRKANSNTANNTELVFVNRGELNKAEAEALAISAKIKTMIASGYEVPDGDGYRLAKLSDFCILLRSAKDNAFTYAKIMNENGVPAHASVTSNFFEKSEIRIILSILRVIDNPDQDIPLLSVLMSPVYGFKIDDIAALRLADRKDSLYVALLKSDSPMFSDFLSKLKEYRRSASVLTAATFIKYLLNELDYYNLCKAFTDNTDSDENLNLLIHYAEIFEEGGSVGLGGFVRFIDKLEKNNSLLDSANTLSENENVVKIMTIHKSKGLEYPVCIIAGCGRHLNIDRDSVVLNMDYGFGCMLLDPEYRVTYTNIVRDVINIQNRYNQMSEELRVLYVAMTRAKEKLIMVSTIDDLGKAITSAETKAGSDETISPYMVLNVRSISEWILMCAVRHPYGGVLRDLAGIDSYKPAHGSEFPWDISVIEADSLYVEPENESVSDETGKIDYDLLGRMKADASFIYPYTDNNYPVRITASSYSAEKSENEVVELSRPVFKQKKGLNAAERGTAFHNFLQFCNFHKASGNPYDELKRLVSEGYLTEEQGRSINISLVRKFFDSEIGKDVLSADRVEKEFRFSVALSDSELPAMPDDAGSSSAPLILQGSIDLFYVKDGEITLVDFKTDNVTDVDELKKRYSIQLELYRTALKKILNKEVSRTVIYSIRLGEYTVI